MTLWLDSRQSKIWLSAIEICLTKNSKIWVTSVVNHSLTIGEISRGQWDRIERASHLCCRHQTHRPHHPSFSTLYHTSRLAYYTPMRTKKQPTLFYRHTKCGMTRAWFTKCLERTYWFVIASFIFKYCVNLYTVISLFHFGVILNVC